MPRSLRRVRCARAAPGWKYWLGEEGRRRLIARRRTAAVSQGYVAVDLGIKFPGAKYAALTSYTAHEATAQKELFFALLLVGTAETIGVTQVSH